MSNKTDNSGDFSDMPPRGKPMREWTPAENEAYDRWLDRVMVSRKETATTYARPPVPSFSLLHRAWSYIDMYRREGLVKRDCWYFQTGQEQPNLLLRLVRRIEYRIRGWSVDDD